MAAWGRTGPELKTLYPISEWNRTVYPSLKWSGWDASIPRPPMPEDTRDILQEVYHIHNSFQKFLSQREAQFHELILVTVKRIT